MRVLVYGGGSVGLGIAGCLLKAGARVDILARPDSVAKLRIGGLTKTGIFGDYHAPPDVFCCFASLDEIQIFAYDYVLVCTKSFDSASAADDLARHHALIAKKNVIVLFQNGWGNAEVFASRFERPRIYNARVITGFTRPRPNEVLITVHADAIRIGSLFNGPASRIEDLCKAIDDGGIPCRATDAVEKHLWAKMLYNCALNPLGAILNVPYGRLAEQESTRTIMNGIAAEAFSVMRSAGFATHWENPEEFLEVFYRRHVPDTAEHRSSTLQDIMANKPTEIDALNGAVIRLAKESGINVPFNLTVYNMVKCAELGNS